MFTPSQLVVLHLNFEEINMRHSSAFNICHQVFSIKTHLSSLTLILCLGVKHSPNFTGSFLVYRFIISQGKFKMVAFPSGVNVVDMGICCPEPGYRDN